MEVVKVIFHILATLVSVYCVLCTIRIILTWIPGLTNGFTLFLSRICDPYLSFFSRLGILRIGYVDFSPILALGVLSVFATIFSSLAVTGIVSFGFLLATVLQMVLSTCLSILNFFTVFLVIRLIIYLVNKNNSNFIRSFDNIINPLVYKIARFFSHGKLMSYGSALIVTIIVCIVVTALGSLLGTKFVNLAKLIPF